MTYENFIQELIAHLTLRFSEDTTFHVKRILKNNNLSLDGLVISDPAVNISPTIYLSHFYDDYVGGEPISQICDELVACYEQHRLSDSIDISFFTDFTRVKNNIIFKLIHTQSNQELLEQIPSIPYYDLSIVFCYYMTFDENMVAPNDTNATILIRNEHLTYWDTSPKQLLALAMENAPELLPATVHHLPQLLTKICESPKDLGIPLDEIADQIPLYVLTNNQRFFGAGVMLYKDILAQCVAMLGEQFYMIPSSIHEVIVLPLSSDYDIEMLNEMVREVNHYHVAVDEVLSDHVYLYDAEKQAFVF